MRAQRWVAGIDVSHHKGEIDWEAVSKAWIRDPNGGKVRMPIQFSINKGTEGVDWVDPRAFENAEGCTRYGIAFGSFHVPTPDYPDGPDVFDELADHLKHLEALKERGTPATLAVPSWLDIEGNPGELSPDAFSFWCHQWLSGCTDWIQSSWSQRSPTLELMRAGIYISQRNANRWLKQGHMLGRYPAWVPDYEQVPIRMPHGWEYPAIMQVSSSGVVDGIDSDVDLCIADARVIYRGV